MAGDNVKLIASVFKGDMALKDFAEELKQLTAEDKEQLAEGIRNGSLTY